MAILTTIDPAGRVVIPKPVRDALRLLPNTRLRVTEQGRRIVLEPVEEESVTIERDGMTLIGGDLVAPPPTARRAREDRLDQLAERASRQRRS
jgi:AbrB family looped-hinge helix DNA binding protein